MDDTQLSLFAGALLSLAFSYVPGLNTWFDGQEPTTKRLIMAGCLLAVSAAIFGAACGNLLEGLPIQATCDQNGFVQIATTFVLALIANQGTFAIAGAGRKKTVEENLN